MAGHSLTMRRATTLSLTAPEGEPGAPQAAQTDLKFSEVYEAHFDFVWRSARRLGVPTENVDDVVQDVFVTAFRKLDTFEGRSALRTWLFGILRHVVRDRRRGLARKPTEPLQHEPSSTSERSPAHQAEQAQARTLLHQLLDGLDPDQREVFVLAELEQLSAPDIAVALQLNVNTVYSRLRAARQRFESQVARLKAREQRGAR